MDVSKLSIQINRSLSPAISNEQTIHIGENFQLQFYNPKKNKITNLKLTVTSHRVKLSFEKNDVFNFEIYYNKLKSYSVDKKGIFTKVPYRIRFELFSGEFFELKNDQRGDISREFAALDAEFKKRAWKNTNMQTPSEVSLDADYKYYGMGAQINQEKAKLDANNQQALAYLNSFEGIFSYFDELKELFAYFKNNNNEDEQQDETLKEIMASLGQNTIVATTQGSSKYHIELAREISRAFESHLKSANGVISVIDAFALYNTLRGIDLVTPVDFLEALKHLRQVDSGLVYEEIKDGVKIIRLVDYNAYSYFEKTILPFIGVNEAGNLTQERLAFNRQMSVSLARIILDMHCRNGFLCVDDHVSGRFYYLNDINQTAAN